MLSKPFKTPFSEKENWRLDSQLLAVGTTHAQEKKKKMVVIHLKLLPWFDSFSIILYIILESFVCSLFNKEIQKPIMRD